MSFLDIHAKKSKKKQEKSTYRKRQVLFGIFLGVYFNKCK